MCWTYMLCDVVGELIFHNRYSYANGNPVNLTDASGKYPIDVWTVLR